MGKKPSPIAAGLALSIFCGLLVFFTTLASAAIGYGALLTSIFNSIYPGYSVSLFGSLVGLIYGLIDGFIVGFVVVWLYNRFAK